MVCDLNHFPPVRIITCYFLALLHTLSVSQTRHGQESTRKLAKKNINSKLALLALTTLGTAAVANAQEIHIFVSRDHFATTSNVYEVINGANGGGAFISRPQTVRGYAVKGYTDRVARRESYMVMVYGSGTLTQVGYKIGATYTPWSKNAAMTYYRVDTLPTSASFSNVDLYALKSGKYTTLHLPIGTR